MFKVKWNFASIRIFFSKLSFIKINIHNSKIWCQYSSPITLYFQLPLLENSTTVKKFPMLLLLFENSLALLLFCHPGKRLNGVVTTWANGSHACVNMPQDSPIFRITLRIFSRHLLHWEEKNRETTKVICMVFIIYGMCFYHNIMMLLYCFVAFCSFFSM